MVVQYLLGDARFRTSTVGPRWVISKLVGDWATVKRKKRKTNSADLPTRVKVHQSRPLHCFAPIPGQATIGLIIPY